MKNNAETFLLRAISRATLLATVSGVCLAAFSYRAAANTIYNFALSGPAPGTVSGTIDVGSDSTTIESGSIVVAGITFDLTTHPLGPIVNGPTFFMAQGSAYGFLTGGSFGSVFDFATAYELSFSGENYSFFTIASFLPKQHFDFSGIWYDASDPSKAPDYASTAVLLCISLTTLGVMARRFKRATA